MTTNWIMHNDHLSREKLESLFHWRELRLERILFAILPCFMERMCWPISAARQLFPPSVRKKRGWERNWRWTKYIDVKSILQTIRRLHRHSEKKPGIFAIWSQVYKTNTTFSIDQLNHAWTFGLSLCNCVLHVYQGEVKMPLFRMTELNHSLQFCEMEELL